MSTFSSYFWAFGSRLSSMFLNFGATLILARLLTPDDFGKIGIVMVIVTISQVLVDSGMASGIINEKKVKPIDYSTVFLFNLGTSIILYLAIFIMAPLCNYFFHTDGLTLIVRIISLQIIINSFQIIPAAKLTRHLNFKVQFWVTFFAQLMGSSVAIILALLNYGVWSLVYQNLVFSVFSVIGYLKIVGFEEKFLFNINSFKKYFSFGAFITLSNIIDQIYENILSLFIGKYMGLAQVGSYTQAKRIETIPTSTLTQVVNKVTYPLLSKYKDEVGKFIEIAEKTQRILLSVAITILSFICFYSDKIIYILLGERWISASYYLVLLSFAGVWIIIENTSKTYLKALSQTKYILYSSLVKRTLAILIIAIACFISVEYLLYGYIIGCIVSAVINSYIISKCIEYRFYTQLCTLLKFAVATILMSLVFYFGLMLETNHLHILTYVLGLSIFHITLYIMNIKELFILVYNYKNKRL